eukprot:COSAG01_NODE_1247_length_11073_cov_23.273465_5_plen_106_part_00
MYAAVPFGARARRQLARWAARLTTARALGGRGHSHARAHAPPSRSDLAQLLLHALLQPPPPANASAAAGARFDVCGGGGVDPAAGPSGTTDWARLFARARRVARP